MDQAKSQTSGSGWSSEPIIQLTRVEPVPASGEEDLAGGNVEVLRAFLEEPAIRRPLTARSSTEDVMAMLIHHMQNPWGKGNAMLYCKRGGDADVYGSRP